jgi:hypothetical protein
MLNGSLACFRSLIAVLVLRPSGYRFVAAILTTVKIDKAQALTNVYTNRKIRPTNPPTSGDCNTGVIVCDKSLCFMRLT